MKAKAYLEQIAIMDSKITMSMEEIENLRVLAEKTTSTLGDDRVQSSGSQQKMEDCIVRICDLEAKLTKDIDAYIDYKKQARELICAVCDADCMKLLHSRYFLNKTWEKIAVEMNYSYKWVSGGLHQRALSQLQKGLDDGKDNIHNGI